VERAAAGEAPYSRGPRSTSTSPSSQRAFSLTITLSLPSGSRPTSEAIRCKRASPSSVGSSGWSPTSALDWRWVLGAVVPLANRPYATFVIMPTSGGIRAQMGPNPAAPPG